MISGGAPVVNGERLPASQSAGTVEWSHWRVAAWERRVFGVGEVFVASTQVLDSWESRYAGPPCPARAHAGTGAD
jgi:hypothetical protein